MTEKFNFIQDILEQTEKIPSDSILSRTVVQNEHMRAILFTFAPGQELSEHTASKPAMLHFLSGEADLKLGGEARQAQANTWVYMQPNLPHSILAKTQVSMLLIMLETPK